MASPNCSLNIGCFNGLRSQYLARAVEVMREVTCHGETTNPHGTSTELRRESIETLRMGAGGAVVSQDRQELQVGPLYSIASSEKPSCMQCDRRPRCTIGDLSGELCCDLCAL